jgi:hypothetical protein
MLFGFQYRCHAIPDNSLAKHMCFAGKMGETQRDQESCPAQALPKKKKDQAFAKTKMTTNL